MWQHQLQPRMFQPLNKVKGSGLGWETSLNQVVRLGERNPKCSDERVFTVLGASLGPRKCETAKPKEHEGKQNCPCCLWSLPTTFFFFLKRQSTPKIKNTYFLLLLAFQLDIYPNILVMTPAVEMSAFFQYNGTKWQFTCGAEQSATRSAKHGNTH